MKLTGDPEFIAPSRLVPGEFVGRACNGFALDALLEHTGQGFAAPVGGLSGNVGVFKLPGSDRVSSTTDTRKVAARPGEFAAASNRQ